MFKKVQELSKNATSQMADTKQVIQLLWTHTHQKSPQKFSSSGNLAPGICALVIQKEKTSPQNTFKDLNACHDLQQLNEV